MNIIIQSSIKTLNKSKSLLSILSNQDLCNMSVPPYYSCIGSHIRHILDIYDCIFEGIDIGLVDLTDRSRNIKIHKDCAYALENVLRVIKAVENLQKTNLDIKINVVDDLGMGKVKIEYTIAAILAQANSHAIHHYAIINYILDNLGIMIQDEEFGYNPTTPRPEEINLN